MTQSQALASASDIQATIAQLFIYPVKSCAGIELTEVLLYDTGFDLDRAWMVVDADGVFVSQREYPRMALVTPKIKGSELILRAPGMLALHINIDGAEGPVTVQVWDDQVPAFDMGNVAAQWFTDFLSLNDNGLPRAGAPKLRLVRFDPEHDRLASKKWTAGVAAPFQFADGFPLLLTSMASVDLLNQKLEANNGGQDAGKASALRFRPNIVLAGIEAHDEDRLARLTVTTSGEPVELTPCKPCTRCSIPNVDPATGLSTPAVNDALQGYRANARMNGAITFGMNAIIHKGVGATLRVGQSVSGQFDFG